MNNNKKVVLITGAASGMGLASAKRFKKDGWVVYGTDLFPSAKNGDKFPTGPECILISPVNVTSEEEQQKVVDMIVSKHGRIDACVTCAGIGAGGFAHRIKMTTWDKVLAVNLTGTYLTIRACLPIMMKQRSGSIVTISSVQGIEASNQGASVYNAAKAGVILLTKNIASDYGSYNIRANSICPGYIETPMFDGAERYLGVDVTESIRKQHKLQRFGKPEEIASVVKFLVSDESSFVSGVALPVDGGFTAGHNHGEPVPRL